MPGLGSSAYNTAEDVLNLLRTILNDSEVAGGDVVTDTAPFTFTLLDAAYRRVQKELSVVGVETFVDDRWLIGLPIMPIVDPEARLIVNDQGTFVTYPNGIGNVSYNNPQLPTDLVFPLKLWERQTNTVDNVAYMKQAQGGLLNICQQAFLVDWEWKSDGLHFRGAQQSQDVKIKCEIALPNLAAPTDPVPIRGVINAAAYFAAVIFTESRGGAILPQFKADAMDEIFLMKQMSARRRQRIQHRRKPYSGRGTYRQTPI